MRRLVGVLAVLTGWVAAPAVAQAAWVPVSGPIASGPGLSAPSVTVDSTLRYAGYLAPSSEIRVSGDEQNGAGFVPFQNAGAARINPTPTAAIGATGTPQLTNDDGRLYLAWSQDGTGYAESWRGVDGWGEPSHGGNPPVADEPFQQNATHDSVSWVADGAEGDALIVWVATNTSGKRRIRLAYDHDGWLHTSDIALADDTDTVTDTSVTATEGPDGGWLVSWREVNGGTARIHVVKWDGEHDTWSALGGAIGTSPTLPTISESGDRNVVQLAYYEGGSLIVRSWNGTDWVQQGPTLNTDPAATHERPSLAHGYIAYSELQASPLVRQVKVAHWDGVKWNPVGGALNHAPSVDASTPDIDDQQNRPTVAWVEGGSIYGASLDHLDPTPVAFSSATYSIAESGGAATITVHRTGDLSREATVDYAVAAGRGVAAATGTLTFPAAEADQTFTVPVTDDTAVNGDAQITLTLSNPGDDTVLGAPATATLTVTDDDTIDTVITKGPDGPTNQATPAFSFEGLPTTFGFECSLDRAAFATCTSGANLAGPLADGPHTFAVRAKDVHGVVDPSPATRTFFVDTVPPTATYVPAAGVGGSDLGGGNWIGPVTIDLHGADPEPSSGVAIVACSVDPVVQPFDLDTIHAGTCPAQVTAPGNHVVWVISADRAGNTSNYHAVRFTILGPPDTQITDGPTGATWEPTPTFSFTSTFQGSTFRCRVDAGPLVPCTSPFKVGTLGLGPHSFEVTATSPAGLVDDTPAHRDFAVAGRETHSPSCGNPFWKANPTTGVDGCNIERTVPPCTVYGSCNSGASLCPVGAKCTYTAKPKIGFGGIGLGMHVWAYAVQKVSDASKRNGGRPDLTSTPAPVAVATCQQDSKGTGTCPASATGTIIGDGGAPLMMCGADAYNLDDKHPGSFGTGRPYLFCDWDVTIEVAAPLTTTSAGNTVTTFAPGAGKVTAAPAGPAGTGARRALAAHLAKRPKKSKKKPAPFKPVTVTTTGAGPVTFVPKLSAASRATLTKKGKLVLRLTLTFTPASGPSTTSTVSITLVKPKPFMKPKHPFKG